MRLVLCLFLAAFAAIVRGETGNSVVSEFPFQFREGLLWVEVNIPQSNEPLNFLVDSGAGVSVINLETAERIGLKLGRKVHVQSVRTNRASSSNRENHYSRFTARISIPRRRNTCLRGSGFIRRAPPWNRDRVSN